MIKDRIDLRKVGSNKMEEVLDKALQLVTEYQKSIRVASNDLKKMKKLFEKGDFSNLATFLDTYSLKKTFETLNLQGIYDELKISINQYIAEQRIEFDKKFLSRCQDLHIGDVSGDSTSEFRIRGILHVRISFQKNVAELKTFARSRKIKSVDPINIASEIKNEINRLFNKPFDSANFLAKLFKAYEKLQNSHQELVLLRDIHKNMWIEKQTDIFFEASDPAKINSYPLDEFSVDLSKLMESEAQTTKDGYACKISLGSGGINIYRSDGSFNSYKFIGFVKGGKDA